MNRTKAEQWLSAMMDGELSPARQRKLEASLRDDPSLADLRDQWGRQRSLMQSMDPQGAPTPEVAWSDVQRALRLQESDALPEGPRARPLHPGGQALRPATALVALVLVLALGAFFLAPRPTGVLATGPTEVEWVESDLPGALSMVYQDEETGWTVIWVDVWEEEPAVVPGEAAIFPMEKA